MSKKKYSINTEDGKITTVEINGYKYKGVNQIPNENDRQIMQRMLKSMSGMNTKEVASQEFGLPKVVNYIFLGVTVLMFIIFGISSFFIARGMMNEKSASATVVNMVTFKNSDGQPFSYPEVVFFTPDKKQQKVQLPNGNWPPAYQVGDQVTVAYNPQNPLEARISSATATVNLWTLPMITGVLFFAFLVATVFVFWINRQPNPVPVVDDIESSDTESTGN